MQYAPQYLNHSGSSGDRATLAPGSCCPAELNMGHRNGSSHRGVERIPTPECLESKGVRGNPGPRPRRKERLEKRAERARHYRVGAYWPLLVGRWRRRSLAENLHVSANCWRNDRVTIGCRSSRGSERRLRRGYATGSVAALWTERGTRPLPRRRWSRLSIGGGTVEAYKRCGGSWDGEESSVGREELVANREGVQGDVVHVAVQSRVLMSWTQRGLCVPSLKSSVEEVRPGRW